MVKKFKIASTELDNRYILAPLAGYTDCAMRKICSSFSSSLNYTEMISAEALFYNSKDTIKEIKDTYIDKENRSRLAIQLFGGNSEHIIEALKIVKNIGHYDFIDFNCGCPVNKVIKQKAGSFWLKRQDELFHLLKEMVKISDKPVILKTRIGFSSIIDMNHFVKEVEKCNVSAIAIHGRTREEFFSSKVHYDVIKECKKNASIPIIANGGINEDNFLDVFKQTDADALMIGQRAVGYPKVFQDMVDIESGKRKEETTLLSQLKTLKKHVQLMYMYKDEKVASCQLRSISLKYLKGYKIDNDIKKRLISAKKEEDYLDVISSLMSLNKHI